MAKTAPARRASSVAFRFNADDTPRGWHGGPETFLPLVQIDLPDRDFPRFNLAAHEDGQLAA